MIDNVITMIESASVIVLAVIGVVTLCPRVSGTPALRAALPGLVSLLTGCMVMVSSVEVVPGIRTDPRAAVVSLSAAIGGPVSVAITASGLAMLRLAYGGTGAARGRPTSSWWASWRCWRGSGGSTAPGGRSISATSCCNRASRGWCRR